MNLNKFQLLEEESRSLLLSISTAFDYYWDHSPLFSFFKKEYGKTDLFTEAATNYFCIFSSKYKLPLRFQS